MSDEQQKEKRPLSMTRRYRRGLVIVGLLSFLLGLLVLVPLLGHASWHAYRDLSAVAAQAAKGR